MPGKVNPARHHRIGERFGVLASSAMAAAPVAAAGGGGGAGGAAAPMAAMGGGGAAAPMAAMGGGGGAPVDVAWVLEVNPEAFVDAAGNMWVGGVNVGHQGVDWIELLHDW